MVYLIYPLYLYIATAVIFFVLLIGYQYMSVISFIVLILLSLLFGYLLFLCLTRLNKKYDFFIVMLPVIAMLLMYIIYIFLFTNIFDR